MELATEHLLLGLVDGRSGGGPLASPTGARPDAIEAEIRSLYGYSLQKTSESQREVLTYEHFTDRARKVMQLANQEAQRLNHECIGTEHILLGLIKEGSGVAAHVLKNLGANLRNLRFNVADLVRCETDTVMMGRLPKTPRAVHVLEFAVEESRNLGQYSVSTEHILLGLLREQEGVGAQVLMNLGLNLEKVRGEVSNLLSRGTSAGDPNIAIPTAPVTPTSPIAPISPLGATGPPASATAVLEESTVLRVLDAAANRAREGLRVVEDYVRFVLDDRHLTGLCKQLRHDLTAALSPIPSDNLLAARETQADVGTVLTTPAEQLREDAAGVLRANFARLQEALRSLEEFGKLECIWHTPCAVPDGTRRVPNTMKQLRYRAYTLERAVGITQRSVERLAAARLYVLLDGGPSAEEFERLARSLIDAGARRSSTPRQAARRPGVARAGQALANLDAGYRERSWSSTIGPIWPRWPRPTAFIWARKTLR